MLLLLLLAAFTPVQALWPIPRVLSTGTSPLTIADGFSIDVTAIRDLPGDLKDAVDRANHYLHEDKLGRLVVGRGPGSGLSLDNAPKLNKLSLELHNRNETAAMANVLNTYNCIELDTEQLSTDATEHARIPSISDITALSVEQRDESYQLRIPNDGSDALLAANTTLGLLRGLTTFSQIWYQYDRWTYTVEAPFDITDEPYYKWRGLLLDTARNFFPVSDIKRTLDAMSWTKLNIFHWHIVDAQSFPLVLPEVSELASQGAYSPDQQYSTAELDDIVSYAASRGIDVMLEIDTPGHTSIVHNSHPEFVACFEATPWTSYANEPPAGQLRLTEQPVIDFTKTIFKAAIKHTPGRYFSTGGDEINARCYAEDPIVQASLSSTGKTLAQALAAFTNQTHQVLLDNGKTPVVWEEMVLDHGDLGLSNDTVVLAWISSEHAKAVTQAGHKIVHAPSDYFYLDCGHGAWDGGFTNGNSWCDPFKTWQKAYSFDPKANLTETEASLVLGGQQLLWTEQSDPSNMDSIIWPRAAASAEVFWTGPIHPNGNPLDGKEALPRLHDLRYRYVQRGVKAIALQPEYCALRPHACDLV